MGGRIKRQGRGALIALLVVPAVMAIALLTFAWPLARLEPRDLPLGVAGPAPAAAQVEARLATQDGAFDVRRFADGAAARHAIEAREVYGAVVVGPDGPTVLTASAASPVVAGMLERAATALGGGAPEASGRTVDVVPADPQDPRGAVLGALVLPLVLAGIIAAVIVTLRGRPGGLQIAALLGACALAALAAIGIVQGWLGALEGPWALNAGVLFLTMAAVAAFVAGMGGLLGHAGLGLGAVLMVLIGNPWSGIASAPELLPEPVGLIGQLLPPGAGGSLLRSTAFFDGSAANWPLLTLVGWAAVGLGAMWAAALVRRRARRAQAGVSTRPAIASRTAAWTSRTRGAAGS